MSYTSVFGGSTIYPSEVSYLALALDADTELEWPLESSGNAPPAARIIDVTPDAAGRSILLPDATLTSAGQTILFNNLGSDDFYVKDYTGGTIATVPAGEQWQLYLAVTTTSAGTWRVFPFAGGGGGSTQPSALAGYGLTVTGSTLSQSAPVTTFSASTTVALSNRASALVWTGTGAGTLNLPTTVSAGNNFFVFVRNGGGGDLTLDPAGSETINGSATLALRPGDSATLITDGISWYTIGLGQQPVFAFDYTSITVTGGTLTLSGSQLNRIAYKFVGTLTSNQTIIVPATVQQYWVNNATTGAFTLSLETASGSPTQVNQNAKGIYYCDGTNIILGSDPVSISTPIVVSDGGTGATTASAARLNLGITTFADPIVTATTSAAVRTVAEAAKLGANSDITSLTGLTTPLSAPQGGTGQSVYAVGDLLYASTTTALSKLADVATGNAMISGGVGVAPAWGKIGLTTHVSGTLAVANGGSGAATFTAGYLKANGTSAFTTVSSISAADISGTLSAPNGGTGQSSYAVGDILYASTTTALSKLADVATGNALISGGIGVAPSWGKIGLTTHVSGTLAIGNGGTGATTAGAALTALGAAASGANTDITSLKQDVTIVASGTIDADTIGFRGLPQTTNTTINETKAGRHIYASVNLTIPANSATPFPIGTTIVLVNSGSTSRTISITSDTLRLAGTTSTGTRTLAGYGIATLVKVDTTVWFISGAGVS